MIKGEKLEEAIRAEATRLGFVACGFAPADAADAAGLELKRWLEAGHHGTMGWMESRAHHRVSPLALWPEAKSAIALGMSYAPPTDPLALAAHPELGRISAYAQGGDYHKTVKKALKALARFVVEQAPSRTEGVRRHGAGDGEAAGAGGGHRLAGQAHQSGQPRAWQLAVPRRDPHESRASSPMSQRSRAIVAAAAARCLEACPTQAFVGPHRIDARRCISYLTIEHDGPIPDDLRTAMGNRIYGCDDCLAVCPWNRFADAAAANRAFLPRAELAAPRLADLLALDEVAFREMFAGSPIKRIGRIRLIRNCLIAAGNSGDAPLAASVRESISTIPIR